MPRKPNTSIFFFLSRLVIETLSQLEPSRKCFRLIGGTLVERTVSEVLPALQQNKGGIQTMLTHLQAKMVEKGQELNEYKTKHNIRTKEEQERHLAQAQ